MHLRIVLPVLGILLVVVGSLVSRGGASSPGAAAAPPTVAPTTSASPTTLPPTTAAPTTLPPTTAAPTTLPPTTAAPAPTTAPVRLPAPVATTPIDPNAATAQRIARGGNGKPFVALTFDAGSDYGHTDTILDYLKAEGIKASFGMTGSWAEKNPAGFRRIVAEGHHLINHSYSHQSWTGFSSGKAPLSAEARQAELDRADQVFVGLGAPSTKPWYRPPYGDLDKAATAQLAASGYPYVAMWSVDTLGWQGLPADGIVARCAAGTVAGGIFLFHVGAASQDAAALPRIVAAIRAAGLTPGNVLDVTS